MTDREKLAALSGVLADVLADNRRLQERANVQGDVGMRTYYMGREDAVTEVMGLLRLAGLASKEEQGD